MGLTFMEAVATWSDAMKKRDTSKLEEILCDEDFSWDSLNSGGSTNLEDTLAWIMSTDITIGDFKTLRDYDDVLTGMHSVTEPGRDETVVLCVLHLSSNRDKVVTWTILRAPVYKGE